MYSNIKFGGYKMQNFKELINDEMVSINGGNLIESIASTTWGACGTAVRWNVESIKADGVAIKEIASGNPFGAIKTVAHQFGVNP